MKITGIIKYTAGQMHAWYQTDQGFAIRKPIGDYIGRSRGFRTHSYQAWWERVINWVKRKCGF